MQDRSDAQLLRDYAERGIEAAFREIVMRHTDFVYSAARRQVDSSDLAADITQRVFVDLARKAKSLGSRLATEASLAGWLHRAARFASLNHLRNIRRQRANEKQAMEQLFTNSEPAADWEQIRPLLDEALDSLGDEDREALLLRYFKHQDFRAVGRALGVSDDAAQKRVRRAVERLREFFSKRNVAIGASGLAVLLSANAVQSAPVGLAAAIATAAALAGTAVSGSTAIATTKTIAMTVLQKSIIGAALIAAVGTGAYEAHQTARLSDQNKALRQEQAALTEHIRQLQREHDDATDQLAGMFAANAQLQSSSNETELLKLRNKVAQLENEANDPTQIAATSLVIEVDRLKQWLQQHPNENIPELQFATETDWLNAALGSPQLKTGDDYRWDMHNLFETVENKFGEMAMNALRKYIHVNHGQFPSDLSQLQPYFKTPVDEAILQRYVIVPASSIPSWSHRKDLSKKWLIAQKVRIFKDYKDEGREVFGPNGYGNSWTFW